MKYKENYWLTNSRMVKYQSMLCENLYVQLEVVKTLNPTTLFWVDPGPPDNDCLEIMDEVFSSQPGLTHQPISHPDVEYFTYGKNFVQESTDFAGYTDTRYAFTTFHFHGSLYKSGGLINLEGKSVRYGQKILKLLKTVWASE
jgi:hypothetical protein